jgi:hypothetical protein
VWPLDEINPIDTPDLARAAHHALELRGAENDSAHGHLHSALVAARLATPTSSAARPRRRRLLPPVPDERAPQLHNIKGDVLCKDPQGRSSRSST